MRTSSTLGFFSSIAVMLIASAVFAQPAAIPTIPVIPAGAPKLAGEGAAGAGATGTVRFQRFTIKDDPTYTGMDVSHGVMPAGWSLKGGIVWHMADAFPAQFRVHWADAEDVAAFDVYPNHLFFYSAAAIRENHPADFRYIGAEIGQPPADQFDALLKLTVARYRPELAQARVVEKKKLKDVAKAAYDAMPKMPNKEYAVSAGMITFEYDLRGKTVQEQMWVTFKQARSPQFNSINWTVENVTSMRGVKGSLEQLNMVRAIMVKSIQPNVEWYDKVSQFVILRQKATMKQLMDQEERRQIFMKMKSDISDENRKAFEKHMDDIDRQSDNYADYMREVSPWKSTSGAPVKLPTKYSYAWEGTNGQIIMNNDPRYDPNSDPNNPNATWTPMQQVQK